jgi:hypothetical protein
MSKYVRDMGKGKAGNSSSSHGLYWLPDSPSDLEMDTATHAAAQWLEMLADEYALRCYGVTPDEEGFLRESAQRLRRLHAQAAADPGALAGPAEAEFLRDVSLQLALWDCDPERPGKGTWLSLAADDLSRLVASLATS